MKKLLLILLCLPFIGFGQNWTQIGQDIDGEAAVDFSGYSVSLSSDGSTVAIGAPNNDGNGNSAGHVRIFSWDGSSWIQLGQDIDGEAAGDQSGSSVSLSSDGSTVAIGATYNNGNGNSAGHVRIYSWDGSSWNQLGQDIYGEAAVDFSGWSVSLSSDGSTVAIGARQNDGNGSDAGHVRIFSWDGSSWNQLGQDIDGEAAYDYSGVSVSLSSDGSTVAIGAANNNGNGNSAGHVRIYSWDGSSWNQLGQDIDGEAASDGSGWSVSLSSDGSTVAIGARKNDGNGNESGHVRIYSWDGSSWIQLGQDIDGEAAYDQSGFSVSISSDGSTVAIGARWNDGNGSDAGHVRIFSWDGSSWIQLGQDIDGEAAGDGSGFSVSLSSDGSTVAIGAIFIDAGHVRVYQSPILGCTDPTATNYDPTANVDDGSCTYSSNCGADVTGMFVSDIIDDRVVLNWDNMNTYDANGDQICRLDKLRIKYRPIGTNTWLWAAMGDPSGYDVNGFCNSTQVTSKTRYQLDMNTTYEWWMRAWYCSGEVSNWAEGPQFTTAPECPVVGNLSVVPFTNPNNGISKADFAWDDSNGPYVFCRIKMRIDTIQNPVAADWVNVGGGSVPYGTFTATKYGLTPDQSYRAQAKGHCDPTGHPAYNSLTWTPLIFWTQPSLRIDGGIAITNLDVYPNPSRDVFNISFTSESVQDLRVRVLNVIGEEIVSEDLQQFVGEYVKSINLDNKSKGIYFLEIETEGGIINKKLILQ